MCHTEVLDAAPLSPPLPLLPGLLGSPQGPQSRLLLLVWRHQFLRGEYSLHIRMFIMTFLPNIRVRITRNKSIFHDEALIGPHFFVVIKYLLIGIITECILFNVKLPVHNFIVVFANGLLVFIVKHISVDIPANGLGRPGLHHYGHGCT